MEAEEPQTLTEVIEQLLGPGSLLLKALGGTIDPATGEPIVEHPSHAFNTFSLSGMDLLFMNNFVVAKDAPFETVAEMSESTFTAPLSISSMQRGYSPLDAHDPTSAISRPDSPAPSTWRKRGPAAG